MKLERLAPLSGVLVTACMVGVFILLGETPDVDDPTEEVVSFWSGNEDETMIASIIAALAAAATVWFGGTLRAVLHSAEGEPGRLSGTVFGGTILIAVAIGTFAAIDFTLADTVGDVPPEVTQTLSVMDSDFFFVLAAGVLVTQLATAATVLRSGGLPKWLGWTSLVIAIVALTPIGFIAFIATVLWFTVVGITIFLQESKQGQASA